MSAAGESPDADGTGKAEREWAAQFLSAVEKLHCLAYHRLNSGEALARSAMGLKAARPNAQQEIGTAAIALGILLDGLEDLERGPGETRQLRFLLGPQSWCEGGTHKTLLGTREVLDGLMRLSNDDRGPTSFTPLPLPNLWTTRRTRPNDQRSRAAHVA